MFGRTAQVAVGFDIEDLFKLLILRLHEKRQPPDVGVARITSTIIPMVI